jgi:hypothetical protein
VNDINLAVEHYDHARTEHTECTARIIAELYLRRKMQGIDANQAAELLADALALRAAAKVNP